MQSKNKPSATKMREIRQMCRMAGKARGRISRQKYHVVLQEIKRHEITKPMIDKETDNFID